MKRTKTTLIISSGQYETCAMEIDVTYTTERGLLRRAKQLSIQHAIYGDNWRGWIPAQVAIANEKDVWGDNSIIGGRWCNPANDWIVFYPEND